MILYPRAASQWNVALQGVRVSFREPGSRASLFVDEFMPFGQGVPFFVFLSLLRRDNCENLLLINALIEIGEMGTGETPAIPVRPCFQFGEKHSRMTTCCSRRDERLANIEIFSTKVKIKVKIWRAGL